MSRLADCYRLLKRRLYVSGQTERAIIDDFHRLYHQTGKIQGSWGVTWRGRPVAQNPMDLLAIARIIQAQQLPVLEIGTGQGGSAWFYLDAGAPHVWTVDLKLPEPPLDDPRITVLQGRSLDAYPRGTEEKLVILDGDHDASMVFRELELFSLFVPIAGYLIVCDTHFNGHPIAPDFGPGPWEAVEAFLAERDDFVRDYDVQPLFTFNPGGYLRRVK